MSAVVWHIVVFMAGNIIATIFVSVYVVPRVVHWILASIILWNAYRASKLMWRARREREQSVALRKRLEA